MISRFESTVEVALTIAILQTLIILLIPLLAMKAARKFKFLDYLGPVVLCYLAGFALINLTRFPVNDQVSSAFTEVTVLLAIPLLLFSTDFLAWVKLAGKTVISFAISVFSVLICSAIGAYIFSDRIEDSWKIAGMLVGCYTGGTPNMSAIGLGLGVSQETFILVNGMDVLVCGVYFLFLITFAKRFLLLFLPAFEPVETDQDALPDFGQDIAFDKKSIINIVVAAVLAVMMAGLSIGLSMLLVGKLSVAIVILSVTTFGIAASFSKKIRTLSWSYETGEYFLLIFCVAIGTMADFRQIVAAGPDYFGYVALVVYGSILIHFALAALFRIDADTVIITSTAAVFGPAFVGPIAEALKNRQVLVSGLTSGLVGYAIGNYVGLWIAYLLKP